MRPVYAVEEEERRALGPSRIASGDRRLEQLGRTRCRPPAATVAANVNASGLKTAGQGEIRSERAQPRQEQAEHLVHVSPGVGLAERGPGRTLGQDGDHVAAGTLKLLFDAIRLNITHGSHRTRSAGHRALTVADVHPVEEEKDFGDSSGKTRRRRHHNDGTSGCALVSAGAGIGGLVPLAYPLDRDSQGGPDDSRRLVPAARSRVSPSLPQQ